jgi:hypothetical protein
MRKIPVLALLLLGGVLPASPAHAGDTVCAEDGVAELCATAEMEMDALAINYSVSQQDGPGSYQIHYVDLNNGFISPTTGVGPIRFQQSEFGTMFGELGHCFRVVLTSTPGTTLQVEPVCE